MGRIHRKIEQLQFAAYCFHKASDSRFQSQVREIGDSNNLVSVERVSNAQETLNNGSNIPYLIELGGTDSGFFAYHNNLLAMLYFADYYHLIPVVLYSDGYPYSEDHPVNGTTNPFEYYYEQPGGISPDDMSVYASVIRGHKENTRLAGHLNESESGYTKGERFLNEMGRITCKYLRLNPTTQQYMDANIASLGINSDCKMLGVHVRGTDFKQNYNGHPVRVTIKEYLDEAIRLYETQGYNRIFLATDDLDAVDAFERQFGERLVYYKDVVRSNGTDTVMHSDVARENHRYQLGLEVLRDMYSLASCQGLVAGLSQVSYAARIQKISTGNNYDDIVIIDKGLNLHRGGADCPDKRNT